MTRNTFKYRIRNNKSNKVKKRLSDLVSYNESKYSIRELLEIDVHFLWAMYLEKKYIDLAADSVRLLYSEMKKQDFAKWMQYNERLRAKKEKKELLERVSKKAGISISKVHLKN